MFEADQSLVSLSESDQESIQSPRLQKDYRFLAANLRAMNTQMHEYRDALETQQQILTTNIWEKALIRGLHSENEIARFKAAFPDFPAQWRLAVIRYSEGEVLQEMAETQIRLCAHLKSLVNDTAIAESVESCIIAMVMDASQPVDTERWETHLSAEMTGIPIAACAISDEYAGAELLHRAFQQASELVYLPGDLPFIRQTQDRPNECVRIPISIPDTEMLYNALRLGQLQSALHILENGVQELHEGEDSAILARFIYNQIANVLARIKLENLSDMLWLTIPLYNDQQRSELFTQELPACFRKICETNMLKKEQSNTRADKIISYVNEHLSDPELGVSTLSEVFCLSSPTLQKLVRSRTGMTLAAYIDEKRIAMANTLLQKEGLTVNDVAVRCGYGSINSFYKAFKRHSGVAPRQMQNARPDMAEQDS